MVQPLWNPEFSTGSRVLVTYCDRSGRDGRVMATVMSDLVIDGDTIVVAAPAEVFALIGHSDHPVLAAFRGQQPVGCDLGLVLIDECEPAYRSLRLVVDNTKDSHV